MLRNLHSNLHNRENENVALIKTVTFTTPLRGILEYFDEICPKTCLPVDFSMQYFSVQRLQNSWKNRAGQPLATVTIEKPRFGDVVAIFAIGVLSVFMHGCVFD